MFALIDVCEETLDVMKSIFSRMQPELQRDFLEIIGACTKDELEQHLECQQSIIKSMMEEKASLVDINCSLQQQTIQLQESNL